MAFVTGTATDPEDLYEKLVAFLTTNTDLVSAGQEWVEVWTADPSGPNPTDKVLRGPGLSGQDQVYVGMRLEQRDTQDAYWIEFNGMSGILDEGESYKDHVNEMPSYVRMFTDVGAVTYWFVANGRRFVCVVKISTIFEACYCGLMMPYADPLSYPYPMFIGGSAGAADLGTLGVGSPINWRSTLDGHRLFPWGYYVNAGQSNSTESTDWIMSPAGEWKRAANYGLAATPVIIGPEKTAGTYFQAQDSNFEYTPLVINTRLIEAYGGDRLLIPLTLIQTDPVDETLGILDGVYRCQGVANSTENLITVDGVDHLVAQNAFRTDFNNFWAVGLE